MKKIIFLLITILFTFKVNAIKVKYEVADMSVNVAEGSIGTFVSFHIYPDDYVQLDTTDYTELVDFPGIIYDDLISVNLERSKVTSDGTEPFVELAVFNILDPFTVEGFNDINIQQGGTYIYRLTVTKNDDQKNNLLDKSISTQYANPVLNCVKLNNVYRKACHNCFQESIVIA